MKNLITTLCLTLAVLLGSVGVVLSCSSVKIKNNPLEEFLDTNIKIDIPHSHFNSKNLVGYINIYENNFDSCSCWGSGEIKCFQPLVLLLENGGVIPLNNSYYDTNKSVREFYIKYCQSTLFNQYFSSGERLIERLDDVRKVTFLKDLIERFSKRCKVEILGVFRNIAGEESVWAQAPEYPGWIKYHFLNFYDQYLYGISIFFDEIINQYKRQWRFPDNYIFDKYFLVSNIKLIQRDYNIEKQLLANVSVRNTKGVELGNH
jgi:hypothetical protein